MATRRDFALVLLRLCYREEKPVYQAFVMAVIISMLLGALMRAHKVYAFTEREEQQHRRSDNLLESKS